MEIPVESDVKLGFMDKSIVYPTKPKDLILKNANDDSLTVFGKSEEAVSLTRIKRDDDIILPGGIRIPALDMAKAQQEASLNIPEITDKQKKEIALSNKLVDLGMLNKTKEKIKQPEDEKEYLLKKAQLKRDIKNHKKRTQSKNYNCLNCKLTLIDDHNTLAGFKKELELLIKGYKNGNYSTT